MNHYTLFPLHPPLMNLDSKGKESYGGLCTCKGPRDPRFEILGAKTSERAAMAERKAALHI